MAKNYSIELIDGITIIRYLTSPSLDDVFAAIDDVAENGPCQLRLWDLSNGFYFSAEEIRQIGRRSKLKLRIPSKVALVAPSDSIFGLARMYDIYREDEQVEHMIFRTEQKARLWLG